MVSPFGEYPLRTLRLKIDANNNIYLQGGYSRKFSYDGEMRGANSFLADYAESCFLMKVNASGQRQWTHTFGGVVFVNNLQVDSHNNPFLSVTSQRAAGVSYPDYILAPSSNTTPAYRSFIVGYNEATGKEFYKKEIDHISGTFTIDNKQNIVTLFEVGNQMVNGAELKEFNAEAGTLPSGALLQANPAASGETLTYQWIKDGQQEQLLLLIQ